MRRIIITGATGFIGRHVTVELLRRGYEVHGIGRSVLADMPTVTWHTCDVLAPGEATQIVQKLAPDGLIHLAWHTAHGTFWTAPENIDWVSATLTLFRAFANSGGRRAVFAGSCAEYDWSHDFLKEDDAPLRPRSLYGHTKHATATMLLSSNIPSVAWARIFFPYGPGEPRQKLISNVISHLLAGQPVACTDGRQERDFMYVKDVADAIVDVLTSDFRGSVNIASGTCLPVHSIIAEIARQMGRPELIRLGALRRPPDDPSRLAASTDLLFKRIGFRPQFAISSGIAETIATQLLRTQA